MREPINLLQSISVFFHLSQGRIEELTSLLSEMSGTPITMQMALKWLGLEPQMKEIPSDSRTKNLIDGLTEDPEDNLDGFIPIIELHNARLNKAHLLHEATSDIIKQKWVEDTDLEDIGKFLQSWAPEPYRNKPMPKGMIQALLGIAPNSQVWVLTDLSNCIFRNTFCILDVIIGRHTWNCQIRTHIHTEIHTHTHTQKPHKKREKTKEDVMKISKPQSFTSVRIKDCTLRVPNKTTTLFLYE